MSSSWSRGGKRPGASALKKRREGAVERKQVGLNAANALLGAEQDPKLSKALAKRVTRLTRDLDASLAKL